MINFDFTFFFFFFSFSHSAKALSTVASTAAFDKNPQSQERGITLDLGFSSFLAPQFPEQLRSESKLNVCACFFFVAVVVFEVLLIHYLTTQTQLLYTIQVYHMIAYSLLSWIALDMLT